MRLLVESVFSGDYSILDVSNRIGYLRTRPRVGRTQGGVMTTQPVLRSPKRRAAIAAISAFAILALAGCSGGGTVAGASATPGASQAAATGDCGSVPNLGANDPEGLLKDFPDLAGYYNGFPYQVQASPWADWKPEHGGPYTAGIVMNPLSNPFQTNLHNGLVSALDAAGIKIIADLAPPTQQDVPE